MLKKLRIGVATLCLLAITALFLDFTGSVHAYLGWLAKIQFLPAVLALNVGIIVALVVGTLIFGRIYCSVICPLGVLQDIVNFFATKRKKNRFRFSADRPWLRYGILAVFVGVILSGFSSIALFIAPYSAFGRIVSSIFAPLYKWANNAFAYFAERSDSYMFYSVDVWMKSLGTLIIAVVTLGVVGFLAWKNGRVYCNTICPVGTLLGFLSKFSLFKIRINVSECVNCGSCARGCKASCMNVKAHEIDYSRCVACMNCIGRCHKNAISYTFRRNSSSKMKQDLNKTDKSKNSNLPSSELENQSPTQNEANLSRKEFLAIAGSLAVTTALQAQEKNVDGGLAVIVDKKVPKRKTPIKPAGSESLRNFSTHCTACQLCVSACPNDVLRPSADLATFMQPEISYERGYCRPECSRCSEVCPVGAILPIDRAKKASTQIGHAVFILENCVTTRDGVSCGNCARHCPTGAIKMIPLDDKKEKSPKIPMIDTERCIGCGACENLCPARPFSAIYVEGHEVHREV